MTVRFDAAIPQFTVPDVVRTAEYYRDILGFQLSGYWDGEEVHQSPERRAVFGIVWRDNVEVFFSRARRNAKPRTGRAPGAYDAYFRVKDVDAFAADIKKRGAKIIDGPAKRPYGAREVVVRDCNGLILAFGEDERST